MSTTANCGRQPVFVNDHLFPTVEGRPTHPDLFSQAFNRLVGTLECRDYGSTIFGIRTRAARLA